MSRRAFMAYDIENQIADTEGKTAGKVYDKEVTLTSAQILAMHTTPTKLVDAPGPGKIIEFVSAILFLDYGTAAYTDGGNIAIRTSNPASYTDVSDVLGSDASLQLAYDTYAMMRAKNAGILLAPDVNAGLEIRCSADHTAGDGTARIKIVYRIHDFN